MKFSTTFLFYNIEVYDPLIRNFWVWALDKHVRIFSRASKLANSSQNVRHFARSQNMQISRFDVIRCVKPSAIKASEGNKRRSGKFFVTGGAVLVSCKTPLTRKALSCLYFRKMKSEEHIVSNLLGYTGPTAKRRMRLCCPSILNKDSVDEIGRAHVWTSVT